MITIHITCIADISKHFYFKSSKQKNIRYAALIVLMRTDVLPSAICWTGFCLFSSALFNMIIASALIELIQMIYCRHFIATSCIHSWYIWPYTMLRSYFACNLICVRCDASIKCGTFLKRESFNWVDTLAELAKQILYKKKYRFNDFGNGCCRILTEEFTLGYLFLQIFHCV